MELSQLRVVAAFQLEKGKGLRTDIVREHSIYFGVFIFLSVNAIALTGHFYFYVKGYEFATVKGNSMLPTLKDGQTTVINYNVPEGNLTDVIVVFGDWNICHRCIKDEGRWLIFKGDNNSFTERVTRDELKAVFIKVSQNLFLDSIILGFQ